MANISGKKTIKANIIGGGTPISANMVQNTTTIKTNASRVPSATTEQKGIIRIATEEEVVEGLSNNTAITPYTLKQTVVSDKHYTHSQAIASDVWVINHNLNKKPSIIVVDSARNVQIPDDIQITSDNSITIKFIAAFSGEAYLN